MSGPALTPRIGFYGKLPTQGDFVSRDLPADFISNWDGWLQRGIGQSRESLGDAWLDLYMTMPPWHFSTAPGVCGVSAMTGVMIPSVDRVGRQFPFTLTMPLPALYLPDDKDAGWHDELEALSLAVLDPGFSMDEFTRQVQSLSLPERLAQFGGERTAVRSSSFAGLRDSLLAFAAPRVTLLWTHGGEAMEASCLAFPALPDGALFAGMLHGDWRRFGAIEEVE